jgi:hypothetical protein
MRYLIAAFLVTAALVTSCNRSDTPASTAATPAPKEPALAVKIEPVQVPVTGITSQPQLTVSSRGLILSWLEQKDANFSLKFAERSASGWSEPRTVASSDNWFISAADVPTVMRMSDGTLVATTYPATDPFAEAYDLRLTYSRDEGKTWARPIAPHHDATKTQHGFATPFERPMGGLGLVWLDGRDQALSKSEQGGDMALYYASFDSKWKQDAETMVNARVCECCQTAVATTADGPIVAFRDRSSGEIRDIYVSRFEQDKWSGEQTVHADKWEVDACPVNGPALSARGRNVAVAWFTAKDDMGQAFAAFSSDAGRTWSAPIRLDDGVSMGHVDIELLDDGAAAATWVEFADEHSQFRLRRVTPSGDRSASVTVAGAGTGRISGYPRLAKQGDDLVVAWTEGSGNDESSQQVKAAVARVPR